MADSASPPEDPIRITCFQPIYSVMDSYGPICFVKAIGANNDHDAKDSVQRAIRENPRNGSLSLPASAAAPSEGRQRLAVMVGKFWAPGRELRIGFQGGSPWQKDQVKKYAPEWCQHANITFTFFDSGEVDILIAFDPTDGSWSYIGTDSSHHKPSMNLGWIDENKRPDDIRSTILHEFGHALGAVHEHESPNASIQWNKEQVYEDLGGPPNHWDRATVDRNMFTVYTMPSVQATTFDPESIMLYYFPASWTLDGKGTKWNTSLSAEDKVFVSFAYPEKTFDSVPFDTGELHPWDKPQQDNVKLVTCYEEYAAAPKLVLGLTSLDIDRGANIRICAYSSDVTPETYKLYLQSWGDTVLYSASLACLEASAERFSYIQTGTYSTQETRPWDRPQTEQSKRIEFATPFAAPPVVVTWLQALDMDKSAGWRIKVYATDVDARGFTIHADTWADSVLYTAGVTWLAYPADQAGVASGQFSTNDVRRWDAPQHDNWGRARFGAAFSKQPKVFMAIDSLDYENSANLRLRVSTSSVADKEMTWHLQSWGDSTMWSAGASYFAWI